MGLVRKIKAGLVKVSVNDFVGEDGNIFFDIDDGILRLSDGATPGGVPLSSGGEGGASTFRQLLDTPSSFTGAAGNFVKVNAQGSAIEFVDVGLFDGDYNSLSNLPTLFDPSDITQSLIPRTDVAIDLGSATKKWRDLYLSGTTIYLGDATISRNDNGAVDLPAGSRVGGVAIGSGGVTSYNDLTDLPTLFSGSYTDLTNKPTIPADISDLTDTGGLLNGGGTYTLPIATNNTLGGIKIGSGLSINGSGVVSVSAAGVTSYNDLTDTPDLSVYQLAATAFDGAYNSLTGAPDLSVYQLASTAFSGNYNDLINTPTIPTVPTLISAFTNDTGYITGYTVTQSDVTQHQAALSITESQISDLKAYLTSVAFADLTSTPTTLAGYGITDAATSTQGAKADTALQPNTAFDVKGSVFADDSTLLVDAVNGFVPFSVLGNKPTTVSGYGITDVYTKAETDSAVSTAVSNLIGDAPAVLDTLAELADAIGDDANFLTTLNNNISLKANTADLAVVATTGSYTDLSNTPTVPTDISELTDNTNLLASSGSNITEDDLITYSILFG